jgi:urease accessory protein
VLLVRSTTGNIFRDRRTRERYRRAVAAGTSEEISLSRAEMGKLRLRRSTDRGTEVGLVLDPGSRLHHGDVLAAEKFIVVKQQPENVIAIKLSRSNRLAALAGHAIGNLHRPIAYAGGAISFPVQARSELQIFKRMLPKGTRMRIEEQVFIADVETHAHEGF